jgi:hypothetical protein
MNYEETQKRQLAFVKLGVLDFFHVFVVTDRAWFIVYLVFGFGVTMSKHVQRLPSCASSGFTN